MNRQDSLCASGPYDSGIHDLSLEDYLAERRHVSSSGLKQILQSPLHLQRYLQRQQFSSPILDFGTAVHCALLEPERFEREYIALPVAHVDMLHADDLRLIQQEPHPVHFITEAQMSAVQAIREQVAAQPEVAHWLNKGQAERSLFWRDQQSGVRCKIRPDLLLLPQLMLELKTTFDATLAVFQRTCLMQRYHLSAAMYRQGVQQLTGQLPQYVFLVVCRHPPYAVHTFAPSAEMLGEGERLFRLALNKLKADKTTAGCYL